jgi:cell division protein FtsX
MTSIVIKLESKANQSKLIEAIEMLKGVKSITVASDEEISDQFLAKQMTDSRKSGKGDKNKVLEFLSQ